MLKLAIETLIKPRETIRTILTWDIDPSDLIKGALLVSAMSGLLDVLARYLSPLPPELSQAGLASPLMVALVQFVGIIVVAVLTDRLGRFFGGLGTYVDALKASVWFAFVWMLGVAFFIVALLTVPALAPLLQLGLMIWMMVVFSIFVQEIHGFQNFVVTLAAVFGVGFVLGMCALIVMLNLGLLPVGELS